MDFRKDINGLRAIAVVIVVLYHYAAPGFGGGYVGVDVFFVISGYLMTQAIIDRLDKGNFSLVGFYWARARRIVPALLALLVVLLGFGAFRLLPLAYAELTKTAISAIAFVSNIVFWRQRGYFDTPPENSWLLHTWSLSVEWQFYLLYPLLLLGLHRLGRGRFLRAGMIGVALVSLALSLVLTPIKPEASFFLLPTRAWEMLLGGLVYVYRRPLPGRLLLALGIAMIAAATVAYDEDLLYPGYFAVVPVLGSALVLAAQCQHVVVTNRASQFLGDVSYSLYLWHWPLLVLARSLHLTLDAGTRVALIGVSLAISWVSFRTVERWFRRANGQRSGVYLARCAGVCAALTGVCLVVVYTRGLPQRVPALSAKNDFAAGEHDYPGSCRLVDGLCTIGSNASARVAVWGDSHAEQLYPALVALNAEGRLGGRSVVMMTHNGCLPIRGIDQVASRRGCGAFNQRTFARVQAAEIEQIVLVAFWNPYFVERICRVTAGGACLPFATESAALDAAREQLTADLRLLGERGKRVSLVLPVPSYSRNVATHLAELAWFGGELELGLTRDGHERGAARVLAMLRSLAGLPGVTLLDPAEPLCPNGQCLIQRDGVTLYRDNNHLTSEASRLLMPLLEGGINGHGSEARPSLTAPRPG
jgi:peptidoglycan/LPS O-acetylase OafA/YrhL